MNLKKITEELLDTFLEAGKIAKEISVRGVKISIKPDKSPVTDGDLAVNKILTKKIENITPTIPIISEESVDFKKKIESDTFWLIDPIDGTRDYINKKDEYTLNAALIVNFDPAIGIIYAPAKERLFFSLKTTSGIPHNTTMKFVKAKDTLRYLVTSQRIVFTPLFFKSDIRDVSS